MLLFLLFSFCFAVDSNSTDSLSHSTSSSLTSLPLDAATLLRLSLSSFSPLTNSVRALIDTSLALVERKKEKISFSDQTAVRNLLIELFSEAVKSLGGIEAVKERLEVLGFFFLAPLSAPSGKGRGGNFGEFLQCPNTFNVAAYDNFLSVPLPTVFDIFNRSFLEIGSGIGYASVVAAKYGAQKVTAIDLSAAAVHCTKCNAVLHGVDRFVEAIQSDLFENLQGRKFDVIFWNIPWSAEQGGTGSIVTDEMTGTRPLLFRLLKDLRQHLTDVGSLFLVICLDFRETAESCISEKEFLAICSAHGFQTPFYIHEDEFEENPGEVIVMARIDNNNEMRE